MNACARAAAHIARVGRARTNSIMIETYSIPPRPASLVTAGRDKARAPPRQHGSGSERQGGRRQRVLAHCGKLRRGTRGEGAAVMHAGAEPFQRRQVLWNAVAHVPLEAV